MSGVARLRRELDVFAGIIAELEAIAGRGDPGRRSELVKLRKHLSEQIVLLRQTGNEVLPGVGDQALADEFRSRLSAALHLVAMHQANWPAVMIDNGVEAYRRSAAEVGASNRGFEQWARAALARFS